MNPSTKARSNLNAFYFILSILLILSLFCLLNDTGFYE